MYQNKMSQTGSCHGHCGHDQTKMRGNLGFSNVHFGCIILITHPMPTSSKMFLMKASSSFRSSKFLGKSEKRRVE